MLSVWMNARMDCIGFGVKDLLQNGFAWEILFDSFCWANACMYVCNVHYDLCTYVVCMCVDIFEFNYLMLFIVTILDSVCEDESYSHITIRRTLYAINTSVYLVGSFSKINFKEIKKSTLGKLIYFLWGFQTNVSLRTVCIAKIFWTTNIIFEKILWKDGERCD